MNRQAAFSPAFFGSAAGGDNRVSRRRKPAEKTFPPKPGQNNQTNSGQEGGGACALQADWPTFSIKSSEPTQSKVLRRRFQRQARRRKALGSGI